jgi:hypothetical protein
MSTPVLTFFHKSVDLSVTVGKMPHAISKTSPARCPGDVEDLPRHEA